MSRLFEWHSSAGKIKIAEISLPQAEVFCPDFMLEARTAVAYLVRKQNRGKYIPLRLVILEGACEVPGHIPSTSQDSTE